MHINKIIFILQIILNLFSLFKCEFFDDAQGMKVIACMNIMDKRFRKINSGQSSLYSSIMLSCFMQITNSQSEKVMSDFETGKISFDVREIDALLNTDFLKSVPEEEIQKKSIELDNIIQEFQKFDDDFSQLKEGNFRNIKNEKDEDKDSDSKMKKINDFLKLDFQNSLLIALFILIIIIYIILKTGITPEKEINKNYKNFKLEEKGEKRDGEKEKEEKKEKEDDKKDKENTIKEKIE